MKNYHKLLFFTFFLAAILVIPNLQANAMEISEDKMMDDNSMMNDSMKESMSSNMMEHIASPREQMKMGVESHQIQCKSGYELVFKSTDWSPSCVRSSSVAKLVMIGWAADHDTTHDMMKGDMKKEMMDENLMKDKTMMKDEMMMNTESKMISVSGIDISMAAPVEGSSDAPITIIEFGDYQCPKCQQWFTHEKSTITKDLIETGKAKIYFLDFTFLGNDSILAAQAAHCAGDQGKYHEYNSILYTNQGGINSGWAKQDALKVFASELGLDTKIFNECLDSGKYSDRVSHNTNVGTLLGVKGTPVFFIIGSDDSKERIDGPQPASIFENTISGLK
ncbi:DSBA oxidoreductase (modular protein) [metagenome]